MEGSGSSISLGGKCCEKGKRRLVPSFGWSKIVMWYCLAIKGWTKYSYTPCYVALPGYRGLERARLISLKVDKYISSTGVGTCVEFKIVIRLCLVIKGWTKYS